jgi:serine O-acetyltransferase
VSRLFEDARVDLARAAGRRRVGPAGALRLVVNRAGLQAVLVYRLGRWLQAAWRRPALWPAALLLLPVHRLLELWVRVAFDIHLERSAEIGPGLLVFHYGGIRLRNCRLGARCVVHQEVQLEPAEPGGAGPTLGDGVWLGPHARVLGPLQLGDGATVGAGALVTQDVPPRTVVLGAPARVMRVDYDNTELLERT